MSAFLNGVVKLPVGKSPEGHEIFEEFTTAEMGLFYPMLVADGTITQEAIPLPDAEIEAAEVPNDPNPGRALDNLRGNSNPRDGATSPLKPATEIIVQKLNFKFQIVWQERLISVRMEAKEEMRKKAEQQASGTDENNLANVNP